MHFSINRSRVAAITCNCQGKCYSSPLSFHGRILCNAFVSLDSGPNAFASLLSNKSPLHHSSVNACAKNLLSNSLQLSVSSKSSMQAANTNVVGGSSNSSTGGGGGGGGSSTLSHKEQLMNFHDQMKKNRPPTKPDGNFGNQTTNPLMNPNQMRGMQSGPTPAAPMRRPGNSPPQQVLLSSDDEIMVNDVWFSFRRNCLKNFLPITTVRCSGHDH